MDKFLDLQSLLTKLNLDRAYIAKELFPGHKHPVRALDRILNGEASLDTEQISKLSLITGMPIGDFFTSNWSIKSLNKIMTFESNEFKAVLDLDNWTSRVFKKDSLLHEEVLHKTSISLKEYIDGISNIINNL